MTVVAAGVIVRDGERILAFERTARPGLGLPCGHVEPGEAVADAALREAMEETGFELALVDAAPYVAMDPVGGKQVHTFLARIVGGALRGPVAGEGTPRWATARELVDGLYGEYNRAAFAHFQIDV